MRSSAGRAAALLTSFTLLACSGGSDSEAQATTLAASTVVAPPALPASVATTAVPGSASATTQPAVTLPASTTLPVTATLPATTTAPPTLPALPALPVGEPVAFSLPPMFVAAGVEVPVVVSVDLAAVGVDVVDGTGAVLVSLLPSSEQFWTGSVPGAVVTGPELTLTPVARTADGGTIEGPMVSAVVLPTNGTRLARREVQADTNVVYDRPWSSAAGELDHIPAEGEGVSTNPPGLARVDDDEVAVLDIAAGRVTCFDLTGASTCTIPLPIAASGDMFPLGDGTLAIIDLGNLDGDQQLYVLRADPHAELVEVLYYEYPLRVAGYPGIATNIGFTWDPPSRTAWVNVPESGGAPPPGDPDPARFLYADALHLDPGGVTRGPTVQRPALRPDIVFSGPTAFRLLDGRAWVTFYDQPAPYFDQLGRDVTDTGVIWMLVAIGATGAGRGTTELVRWRPGDAFFDAFPIDFNIGEDFTRRIAAMDDDTVAVLDLNVGGRVRAFTFPPLDAREE